MRFCFDKAACQNIRKSLRREWIETNGLGDYASSSLVCCNMRKYHGLLVANLGEPAGRYVLLSTMDEILRVGTREFSFSSRKHPGVYHPHGYKYLQGVDIGEWSRFIYKIGGLQLTREIMLMHGKHQVLLRYTFTDDTEMLSEAQPLPPVSLRLRPLLAYRSFHELTHANVDLQVKTWPAVQGFKIQPYNALPPLYMQTSAAMDFSPSPDWYHSVKYLLEEERGYPCEEDLFQPGVMDLVMEPGKPVYVVVGTEPFALSEAKQSIEKNEESDFLPTFERLEAMWNAEASRRMKTFDPTRVPVGVSGRLMRHLVEEGERFLINTPWKDPAVIAGYHWFDAWGRDSLIALPGLTFCAGRAREGMELLRVIGESAKGGIVPNCYAPDGKNHACNSVDASLWYAWAVQQLLIWAPEQEAFVREVCWPVLKNIVRAYSTGRIPNVRVDSFGLLHAGDPSTQLTWMDATVNGKPVTPRNGCPSDINALWYNALAFVDYLARKYDEPAWKCADRLASLRASFIKLFYVPGMPGYIADVWRSEEEGGADRSIRPNMIFAVSLPFSILEDDRLACVVETVRNNLLTPYGLRTLSPNSPNYEGLYEGNGESRDRAYHQGTVWPWLLGAYGDALLRVAWDVEGAVRDLLMTLTPLFTTHLADAGIGSISEIFDGNPPHLPGGTIAQAWSVGECLRLLCNLKKAAPTVYAEWEIQFGTRATRVHRG